MTRGRALLPTLVDAAAAGSTGVGVLLMVLKIKPVPNVISTFLHTPFAAYGWTLLLIFGSLAGVVGCCMRTKRPGKQQEWSYMLEFLGWPCIACSAVIFAFALIFTLGFVPSLLSLGFTGFVVFTTAGHWWELNEARRLANRHANGS